MKPLFVSYIGRLGGQSAQGWCVIDHPPLVTVNTIKELVTKVEDERKYDAGTLVLITFRRLEDEQ